MKTLGTIIKGLRGAKKLKIKDLAALTNIDQALLSKIENGVRLPTDHQLVLLAETLKTDFNDLRKMLMVEKVYELLKDEEMAHEILMAAEPRLHYLTSSKVFDPIVLSDGVKRLLQEIDALNSKYRHLKDLKGIRKQKMHEYISVQYTYESNRIEGNTLNLSETAMVINEGITIAGKSVSEHLEAINHAEAIEFIYDLVNNKVYLNKNNLLQLHGIIFRGIDRKYGGRYRDVPVRISGAMHIPPQPFLIEKMMEEYFEYYHMYKNRVHPVILAAEMHERLVSIHPFIDGNGRTSRLVMNLILLSYGFPIAILKGDNDSRRRYYNALSAVQNNDEPEAFYTLVCEAVLHSLNEHIELSM